MHTNDLVVYKVFFGGIIMNEAKGFKSLLGFSFGMTVMPFLASVICFFCFIYEREALGISALIASIALLLFAIVGGIFALGKWSSTIYIYEDKVEQKQFRTLVSIKYDEIEKVEIVEHRLRRGDYYTFLIYAHNQKIEMSMQAEFDYFRKQCTSPIFTEYVKLKEKDHDWLKYDWLQKSKRS